MKILILTHHYPPEIGAPQARLSEMAKVWQTLGHEVTVVTTFPNHPTGVIPPEYQGHRFMEETLDGISIKRCWVYATPNTGFFKRILNHLSFMISAVIQGHRFAKGADVIVSTSPPFFTVCAAFVVSKWHRVPYVFEVRDLWPAIFKELGVLTNPYILWFLERIELFLYRHAALIVPVTDTFSETLQARGIPRQKLFVVKNGVNPSRYHPKPVPEDLKAALGLTGKFIVGYMGAHGISHALIKVIDAAERLAYERDIHFLFIGEGAEKGLLQKAVSDQGLTNVTFVSGQDKAKVPDFYAVMDTSLVPLRNIALFKGFIPSKMFEIMGMERAIIGMLDGEPAKILSSAGALVGPAEDVDQLCANILRLYQDPTLKQAIAKKGREFVMREFNRDHIAQAYVTRLSEFLEKGR